MNLSTTNEKKKLRFPFYVVKKMGMPKWKYWTIRVVGILLAFLLAGLVCTWFAKNKTGFTLGVFFSEMFRGTLDFTDFSEIIDLFATFAITLLIALALTPAFKMKFWNIGAEGQVLMGGLAAAGIAKFAPSDWPNAMILIFAAIGGMVFGVIWSVIPALFKAFFNTNETLFTLMMNYIAALLAKLAIDIWVPNGSQSFGVLKQGTFPEIFDNTGTLVILFGVVIFVVMFFYIKFSKQGYEIAVVGESLNTARYIGINIKKVIIRTMIITGALCGLIGFFIVCGVHTSFADNIVGGKGFTGVLIAWLGHFEPGEIAFFSFLAAFMEQGSATAATASSSSSEQFYAICTGVFFIFIIACEFFSNYQVKMHLEKDFHEQYDETNTQKLNNISEIQNRFVRFWATVWYYICKPFVFIALLIAYKVNKNKKEVRN